MKVPQVLPWLGEDEMAAISRAIGANWITEGPLSAEFSSRLNELLGTQFGVFAPNGTLALFLGMLAMGIGRGDEVLVPDCTFIGSANAIILTGARPVFVEVNRYNYQIEVSQCEDLVTSYTRAIMPVHLYGMTANMTEIMEFAQRRNLNVIEDAAQAIGVRYKGQHAGTFGDVGCFSFFADKTITTGEGGYVVCKDNGMYERLLLLRNQGRFDRGSFLHPSVGYNFRITDLQAAIGLAQLNKLGTIIDRKHTILELYQHQLKSVEEVTFLAVESGSEFVPFRVVIICREAHPLMAYLSERGVQCRTLFYPLHKQPCFAYLKSGEGRMPDLDDRYYRNAIYGYEHGVCLPVFPTLVRDQISYVCTCIKEFYRV